LRALLLDGQANTNGTTCTSAAGHTPAFAVKAQTGARHATRAVLAQGRVVKMTPRALARFQSFPDWYELPERNALACRIIGNAVPPLLMQRVMEGQKKLFGEE
jgi:site-specific DNA-cytosine methylase